MILEEDLDKDILCTDAGLGKVQRWSSNKVNPRVGLVMTQLTHADTRQRPGY